MNTLEALVRLAWLVGAAGFVLGLMRMNSPATARNGNLLSAGGMAIAIGGTAVLLAARGEAGLTGWIIILAGIAVGGGLGLYTARTVKMTAMPQLVSLFNAVGGGAAALIDIVIGGITFTGSLIASGKLMGVIPGKPIKVPGGQLVTAALAAIVAVAAIY